MWCQRVDFHSHPGKKSLLSKNKLKNLKRCVFTRNQLITNQWAAPRTKSISQRNWNGRMMSFIRTCRRPSECLASWVIWWSLLPTHPKLLHKQVSSLWSFPLSNHLKAHKASSILPWMDSFRSSLQTNKGSGSGKNPNPCSENLKTWSPISVPSMITQGLSWIMILFWGSRLKIASSMLSWCVVESCLPKTRRSLRNRIWWPVMTPLIQQ